MSMVVDWTFASDIINLGGSDRISREDAERQTRTAEEILNRLRDQPGVLLADEVGMGKTFVALAVVASVIRATRRSHRPVVVMVPKGLVRKWQRDWEQFKSYCVQDQALNWVRDRYAPTPAEFFKLLDNPPKHRPHLIFINTGCFFRGLSDLWIELAMIRLARRHTKLNIRQRRRLVHWATALIRRTSNSRLTEAVIATLMRAHLKQWKRILTSYSILREDAPDPVPRSLIKVADKVNWSDICRVIQSLPRSRPQYVSDTLCLSKRYEFEDACHNAYQEWLKLARWHSPLLVLDEAHHAKNDTTRLAKLFREESEKDLALLKDKFDRMLFLTATPFQLGHQELIRVLKSFAAVRWDAAEAPKGSPEKFLEAMGTLEKALDASRLAARRFDRAWGRLRPEMLAGVVDPEDETQVSAWWESIDKNPETEWQRELVEAYNECLRTKNVAEKLLRPWVIRHNRLPSLPGNPNIPRRRVLPGKAILDAKNGSLHGSVEGLPIEGRALLPFLIAAHVQGQLAQYSRTRAYFAEGLVSSYEAFHHTRENRAGAKDFDDGLKPEDSERFNQVPISWYEKQIAQLIPSRSDPPAKRLAHPKVDATVQKAVDLWSRGEKVLIFCFYVQTAQALYEHLREQVNQKIISIAGQKLGLDPRNHTSEIEKWLMRIAHRLTDEDSPLHREILSILKSVVDKPDYAKLRDYRSRLLAVLMAYFRSPPFVARYLPLDDLLVREALSERQTRRRVIARGIDALRHVLTEEKDESDQTFLGRVEQFLRFAVELAERAHGPRLSEEHGVSQEPENPLDEYLNAVSVYSRPRRPQHVDQDEIEDEKEKGIYRVVRLVRMIYGGTKPEVRDRLMLAFNSPLFPEILVCSSVMAEGVDLHRFCRHVIHHDLCWNPSTLEQRTGRLDRVGCKAELCGHPIEVYLPFIAGSADEKMFRVLRDRERWFQIVMGQKYEFDEATSQVIASRILIPDSVAHSLTFDLSCWHPCQSCVPSVRS